MSTVKFKFSGDSSELLKELENVKAKIRETSGQAANIGAPKGGAVGGVNKMTSAFKGLLPAIGAAAAATTAFGAAWSAVKTGMADAMDDEYMAVQLSSYTKSIESAKALQSQLDHLAANGVVGLDDLGKGAQNLAMHFRTNNTAIMSWSEVFADIAASGKISAEQLSNSWAKVMANGFADSRAINQLQNQGIPIIKALAEEMGVAEKQVIELAKKREISADQYVNAMRKMRDAEFSGKNSALSNTTIGSWETLKATFENAMGDAFSGNARELGVAFRKLTAEIEKSKESASDFIGILTSGLPDTIDQLKLLWNFSTAPHRWIVNMVTDRDDTPKAVSERVDYLPTGAVRADIEQIKSYEEANQKLKDLYVELYEIEARRNTRQKTYDQTKNANILNEIALYDNLIKTRKELIGEMKKGLALNWAEKNMAAAKAAREAEEAEEAQAKALEEVAKKTEKANEAAMKARDRWTEKGIEREINQIENPYQKIEAWLKSADLSSIDDWNKSFNELDEKLKNGGLNLDESVRYEKLLAIGEIIRGINEEISKTKKKGRETEDAERGEIAIMQAELAGEKEKARELKKQRDIRREINSLISSGVDLSSATEIATQKITLAVKLDDKKEKEKEEKKNSKEREKGISDAFKTRFDAVQQTLSSVSRVGSGFGSLFSLVGKGDAGLSAAVDSLTKEVEKSNGFLKTIAEKAGEKGTALFS